MSYNNQIISKGTYKFIDTPDLSSYTAKTSYDIAFKSQEGNSYTGIQLSSDTINYLNEVSGYHFVREVQWEPTWSSTDDQTTWTYTLQSDITGDRYSSATYKAVNTRTQETTTVNYSVIVDKTTGEFTGDTEHNNSANCVSKETSVYQTEVYTASGGWKSGYQTIIASDSTTGQIFQNWFGKNTTATITTSSYKWDDTIPVIAYALEQADFSFESYGTEFSGVQIDTSGKISYKNGSSYTSVYTTTSKWNTDTSHRQYITVASDQTVSGLFFMYFTQSTTAYTKIKLPAPSLSYTTSSTGYVVEFTNNSSSIACIALVNGSAWSSSVEPNGSTSKSFEWVDTQKSYSYTAYAAVSDIDLYEQSDSTELTVYKNWLNEPVLNAVDYDNTTTNITIKNTNDVSITYYVNNVLQGSIGANSSIVYSYYWGSEQTSADIVVAFKDPSAQYGDATTEITLSHQVKLPAPRLTITSSSYDSYSFTFFNSSSKYLVQPYFDGAIQGTALQPSGEREYTFSWNEGQTSKTINAYSMPVGTSELKQSDVRTITITRATSDTYALDIEYQGAHYTFGGSGGTVYVLEPATTSTLGGIIVGDNLTIDEDGKLNAVAGTYTLPTATTTKLGGIKVGTNLSITSDGTLNATDTVYTLPKATTSTLGGIIVGDNLSIDNNGVLSASAGSSYTLPIAGATTLGGIKIGENLIISQDGTLKAVASTYTLPLATDSELGGVKIGYTTSESNRKFAVQLDTSNKMFVNVPYATYSVATTSSSGLMSTTDKAKLDGLKNVEYEVDDTNLEITLTL